MKWSGLSVAIVILGSLIGKGPICKINTIVVSNVSCSINNWVTYLGCIIADADARVTRTERQGHELANDLTAVLDPKGYE